MSGWRAAAALITGSLLASAPALADEPIARRLAVLKSLASPGSVRVSAGVPGAGGCGGVRWWRVTGYGLRARIEAAVRDAALRYAVDPALIRAVIRHESAFDPDAVSHKGAMGLMQLMPATAREFGVVCPFEPRENVMAGSLYLRRLHDRFGRWPLALAAYNAGPRRVEARQVPEETRRYVRLVVASWRPRLLAWIELD